MHQNITLTGRRESAKLGKSDLNNFGNFAELLWHETLRNMFRMPNDCFIFYCLSLDFFCGISRQTITLISYGFFVLRHGWYMQSNSGSTV